MSFPPFLAISDLKYESPFILCVIDLLMYVYDALCMCMFDELL